MKFQTLTDLVLAVRKAAPHIPPSVTGVRERAAYAAAQAFGIETALKTAALVNVSMLGLLTLEPPNRLLSHRITPGAVSLVHATDLRTIPGEPPVLLRQPWIAEVRHPESGVLFGDTVSFACYPLDGKLFMIGLRSSGGAMVSHFTPRWHEREVAVGDRGENNPFVSDSEAFDTWSQDATRFSLLFALHREAENTPVIYKDQPMRGNEKLRPGRVNRSDSDWIQRTVFLDRITRSAHGEKGSVADHEPVHREGLMAASVMVRGFMRRQPHGPGGELRKWVYVESHEARRWVAPKPVRIVVDVSKRT